MERLSWACPARNRDKHICVFLQREGLLKKNKFKRIRSVHGKQFARLSACFSNLAKANAGSCLPISITNINSYYTAHSKYFCMCFMCGLQKEYKLKRLLKGSRGFRGGLRESLWSLNWKEAVATEIELRTSQVWEQKPAEMAGQSRFGSEWAHT